MHTYTAYRGIRQAGTCQWLDQPLALLCRGQVRGRGLGEGTGPWDFLRTRVPVMHTMIMHTMHADDGGNAERRGHGMQRRASAGTGSGAALWLCS